MSENKTLKQGLNLFDSVCIVAGSMIGSGIFIVSADMARTLGSSFWILVAWIFTEVVTILGALCYAELACNLPYSGGMYIYLKEAYGKLFGFLYGWSLFMVIQSGTIAAVAVAFSKFTGEIFSFISSTQWLFTPLVIGKYTIGINTQNLLAIFSIILLTYININGLDFGKLVQNIFTVTKILSLIAIIILGLTIGFNTDVLLSNFHNPFLATWTKITSQGLTIDVLHGASILPALSAAMVGSLFSAIAWDTITYTGSEVKNPKRNIPLSLVIGTSLVILLYFLVNVSYLCVLPLKGSIAGDNLFQRGIQFALEDRVGTAVSEVVFGNYGSLVMAVLIMISTFGCNNGIILSTSRVYYSMAQDGLFFKSAAKLNSSSVPGVALIIQCVWSCILCMTGTYSDLLDFVVFSLLIFYILAVASVFILRKKMPREDKSYKVIGYPFTPLIYILLISFIGVSLLIYKPLYTWPGLIIVFLGIPVFYLLRSVNKA